ncbi:hypothetical protein ACLB2K_026330 [Fragaria x ananassa]
MHGRDRWVSAVPGVQRIGSREEIEASDYSGHREETQIELHGSTNLSDGIDNVALQDMFRKFGNVLSCKVAMFEDGKSKGYGFVQFETEESALAATDKLNGFTVADKQLCEDVQEKHRVIGSGAMDEYKNDNGLLCGTSEL